MCRDVGAANTTAIRRFAMLIPTKDRCLHARMDRYPCRHPRNKSSSTIGCQTTANRKTRDTMRCHGNGWTATRSGNTLQKAAPTARQERNIGER
jgi:hypothetical protein